MNRITTSDKHEPSIRDINVRVSDVLCWLGSGMSQEKIMEDHPDLEGADFLAVYNFAASCIRAEGSTEENWRRIRRDLSERLESLKDNSL